MRKFLKILLVIIVIAAIAFIIYQCSQTKSLTKSNGNNKYISTSLESFYPETGINNQIIKHIAYTLEYNESTEQANWVAYILTAHMVQNKIVKRSNHFMVDHDVNTESASPSDYKKSGYDKGHLCPAADMEWNKQVSEESFYMSNMSPQEPEFNRGIWRELEEQVRKWAIQNDSLLVITGPVFKGKMKYIGTNDVSVPAAYYKIVADISYPSYKTIAFIIPNKDLTDGIFNHVVSIDSIETTIHIKFFEKHPEFENLENSIQTDNWR